MMVIFCDTLKLTGCIISYSFSVLHILSNADASWQGVRGRVNKELIQEHLPKYNVGQRLYICGHIEFSQTVIK